MSQRRALVALLAAVMVAAACAPEAPPRSARDEDPGQPGVPGSAPPSAPSVVISARVTITLGDSGGQPGAEAPEGDADPASPADSAAPAGSGVARPEPTLVVRGALVQLGAAGASARLLLLPRAPTRCTPAPSEKGAYALQVQWEAGAVARFVRMATGEPTYNGGLRVNDAPRTAGAKGRITLDDEPDHTVVGGAVDVLVCP